MATTIRDLKKSQEGKKFEWGAGAKWGNRTKGVLGVDKRGNTQPSNSGHRVGNGG